MAGKRVEEKPEGQTKRSGVGPFKAVSNESEGQQRTRRCIITESKSLNTREGRTSYSKWPQESLKKRTFKFSRFGCRGFQQPQQKSVFRVVDQGS